MLETAAGTGIVTRALAGAAPEATIIATDINPAVVAFAAEQVQSKRVEFLTADAQNLPFQDGAFDLVVCLFGIMFFPDKVRANAEARRVRSGPDPADLSGTRQSQAGTANSEARNTIAHAAGSRAVFNISPLPSACVGPVQHVALQRMTLRNARMIEVFRRLARHAKPLHHALRAHVDRRRHRDDFRPR
jgi:hypothetical protein